MRRTGKLVTIHVIQRYTCFYASMLSMVSHSQNNLQILRLQTHQSTSYIHYTTTVIPQTLVRQTKDRKSITYLTMTSFIHLLLSKEVGFIIMMKLSDVRMYLMIVEQISYIEILLLSDEVQKSLHAST